MNGLVYVEVVGKERRTRSYWVYHPWLLRILSWVIELGAALK